MKKNNSQFNNFKKEIEIKDVSFIMRKITKWEKFNFKNLNFKIKLGKKVGIYSKSGAGKILFRSYNGFLTPSFGEILIDGVNIKLVPSLGKNL